MTPTVVVFKTKEGLEITQQGSIPSEDLIAQATEEYGEIEVISTVEGTGLAPSEARKAEALVHVLQAAEHNVGVILNQIESLDDDHELPEIKDAIRNVVELIDQELKDMGVNNG